MTCRCHCPCRCKLQPAVLFTVRQRVKATLAWLDLGHTNDLSLALYYKDKPAGAWIDVRRGFIDEKGILYDDQCRPVKSLLDHHRRKMEDFT